MGRPGDVVQGKLDLLILKMLFLEIKDSRAAVLAAAIDMVVESL
jgi:hypothetical protein